MQTAVARHPARRGGTRARAAGFSFIEFSVALSLLSIILLGLVLLVSSTDDDSPYPDITPYKWTNALYTWNQVERLRTAVRLYQDQTGALPGDFPHGNANGRIEKELGEAGRVFDDLRQSGTLPDPPVLVRGRKIILYYAELRIEGQPVSAGHFFKLERFDRLEAVALDRKFDDARGDSGSVIVSARADGDGVDCYIALDLF
ncbi:hypothetical protein [Desulfocurvus sp.]|jgi:hypothetical protein|uniref:hypothetical protein n=1 Tax=Desulfocurvus sp. TaxID=2871698 RepID=UPI0025C59834|nr:hypothetical protein [Desulfocurvus sp.]MCK9241514.1 hypothetical protein [Desulfocurvus sp.]